MNIVVLYALAALEVAAVGVVLFLTLYLLALIFKWPKKTKKFGVIGAIVFF